MAFLAFRPGAALLLAAAAGAAPAAAQSGAEHPRDLAVRAVERTSPIALDGRLDEAVWASAPAAGGFTQQDPQEGRPATQRTEVRFAYDADALYVGARMYDSLGAAGVRTRLVRHDQDPESDYLQLVFDTFHDHSGRTLFLVNPSGVKNDAGQATPTADPSWDPVWEAATAVDSAGWTAELRIPFSQLRFSREADQTWGMQVWRYSQRVNEISMWSFWGKNDTGGPARFGHLEGIRVERRPQGLEVLPYTVARASYVAPTQPGSPFQDASAYNVRVGADVKALLGSSVTLSATLNPDFGQVEVDPATVNLSAFETFFEERRPFFVEGSGLFSFGGLSCFTCSNANGMSLFYSRRIGRRPQGGLPGQPQFWDVPESTDILGAAKVTGRFRGGWQVGVLDAVTGSEEAGLVYGEAPGVRREVEPLSNYFVGRLRRTMRGGDAIVGAMATSVARRFGYDSLAHQVPEHAEAAGVDWTLTWAKRAYELRGNLAASQVSGDPAAILRLQRSSARYFQRPDRDHGGNGVFSDRYDPLATSLRGFAGYARVAKQAGSWQWEAHSKVRSPGFEANDLGFVTRSDFLWFNANLLRSWNTPTRWYRRFQAIVGGQQQYNFDGDRTDGELHAWMSTQLPNYWSFSNFVIWSPDADDDRLTRGGPVVRRAGYLFYRANFNTDYRKALVLTASPSWSRNTDGAESYSMDLSLRVKPASNVEISAGPGYGYDESRTGFVDRFADETATEMLGQRAVFADLTQHTLYMDTRLNWTFSPTLTLELFAQPYVASGRYTRFKEFVRPREMEKRAFDAAQIRLDEESDSYVLDPDRNPATANFTFDNPDFNFRSLRGNAVVRWEYRPGSTLFLVWQQQRSGEELFGDFDLSRDAPDVFRQRPQNIFVVKMSYWFGRLGAGAGPHPGAHSAPVPPPKRTGGGTTPCGGRASSVEAGVGAAAGGPLPRASRSPPPQAVVGNPLGGRA
ncbi:MAG: DUF5916 domain-containing protein, partial [Longimicrobiaceae bacterium]